MSIRSQIYLFGLILFVYACSSPPKKNEDGKQLAKTYCGSCHLLPLPSQLNKETWLLDVLPKMGPRLGIHSFQGMPYPIQHLASVPEGYYPSQPVMTKEDWAKIVSYFYEEAPDSLEQIDQPISTQLDRFEVKTPKYPATSPPVTSYVKIDPGNHAVYLAHGQDLKLRSYNQRLQLIGEAQTPDVMVDIGFQDLSKPGLRTATLLTMGALTPLDVTHGSLQRVAIDEKLKITLSSQVLIDSLPRPVNLQEADLNNDGKLDFVISRTWTVVTQLAPR